MTKTKQQLKESRRCGDGSITNFEYNFFKSTSMKTTTLNMLYSKDYEYFKLELKIKFIISLHLGGRENETKPKNERERER